VLEFDSSLLYDNSTAAYHALEKLWRRLPPRPQVVMVIDANTLLSPQTELLRQSGHALFGKLKVFSELEGAPLPLILALSHMEKVQGFVEFCVFLEEAGIPLQLDFPTGDGINQLEACLDYFQQHLQRALITRPAQDYLKIISFLNEAPRIFSVLIDVLRIAGLEQGVDAPSVVRLCLLSEHVHSFGCQPFALPAGIEQRPRLQLKGHAKVALGLALAGLVYFIGSYSYQKHLIADAYQGIKDMSYTPVEDYSEKISPLFIDFSANLNKNPLLSFMPGFFEKEQQKNNELLIVNIRKYYLLPILKQIQNEPNAHFKTIRWLALLYSTSTNEMGDIIKSNPNKNPVDMFKYRQLIDDYISYNTHTEGLDSLLNEISLNTSQGYLEDKLPWVALFHDFQKILKKSFIQEAEFKELQEQLIPFLQFIDVLVYHDKNEEEIMWLNKHTNLHFDFSDKSYFRQKSISQLLILVSHLKLNIIDNCPVTSSLIECLGMVQVMANAKIDSDSSGIEINLDGEYFSFTPKQWNDLITRSRITLMLRNLIANHRSNDGWIFFSSPSIYTNVEMNSSNNDGIIFTGNTRIDGRLTIDAFEKNVKPAIMALTDIVANLPIDSSEKKNFNAFVLKNLDAYSGRYVSSYLNYFKEFQIHIDSNWALNYVLHDLQEPNSQLLNVLVQIKNNTALTFPASVGFQSFAQKLIVFRFIQQLMEEKNGIYPEFQKYQLIMSQMQQEMNAHEPYEQKKMIGDSDEALRGALSPLGRLAWSMQLNEEGSYLKLTKSWLQKLGIQADWQQPFLAPAQKVKEYGTTEINLNIAGIWADIWDSNVAPLLVKFPFSENAAPDNELTVDDLMKTFHPKQGLFWDTFNQYLAPLSKYSNGVWVRQHELSNNLVLPNNYLSRLNAIQMLTTKLWDSQGNPKPLDIFVKPGLLPTFDNKQIPLAPLVSLAYLRQGNASVLSFNQQAEWQKFPLEWWLSQPAEVGMEFRKDADPTRVYTDMIVDDSNWNLFKLLQRGHVLETQRYRWSLAHPNFPQQPLNLEFYLQGNPMAVFTNLAGS
jgi:type VI secretion system protein ImpL